LTRSFKKYFNHKARTWLKSIPIKIQHHLRVNPGGSQQVSLLKRASLWWQCVKQSPLETHTYTYVWTKSYLCTNLLLSK